MGYVYKNMSASSSSVNRCLSLTTPIFNASHWANQMEDATGGIPIHVLYFR